MSHTTSDARKRAAEGSSTSTRGGVTPDWLVPASCMDALRTARAHWDEHPESRVMSQDLAAAALIVLDAAKEQTDA